MIGFYLFINFKINFSTIYSNYFIRSISKVDINNVTIKTGSEMNIDSNQNNMCGISTFAFVPVLV
jgi:hypothetical protein